MYCFLNRVKSGTSVYCGYVCFCMCIRRWLVLRYTVQGGRSLVKLKWQLFLFFYLPFSPCLARNKQIELKMTKYKNRLPEGKGGRTMR